MKGTNIPISIDVSHCITLPGVKKSFNRSLNFSERELVYVLLLSSYVCWVKKEGLELSMLHFADVAIQLLIHFKLSSNY